MENTRVKQKQVKYIIAILLILFFALAVGKIVYSNMPEQRIKSQIDLGYRYLNEMNYEQAMIEFDKTLQLDGSNVEAMDGLASSCVNLLLDSKEKFEKTLNDFLHMRFYELPVDSQNHMLKHFVELIENLSIENQLFILELLYPYDNENIIYNNFYILAQKALSDFWGIEGYLPIEIGLYNITGDERIQDITVNKMKEEFLIFYLFEDEKDSFAYYVEDLIELLKPAQEIFQSNEIKKLYNSLLIINELKGYLYPLIEAFANTDYEKIADMLDETVIQKKVTQYFNLGYEEFYLANKFSVDFESDWAFFCFDTDYIVFTAPNEMTDFWPYSNVEFREGLDNTGRYEIPMIDVSTYYTPVGDLAYGFWYYVGEKLHRVIYIRGWGVEEFLIGS